MNFIWHDICTTDVEATMSFYGSVFSLSFTHQPFKESNYYTFSNEDGDQGGVSEIPKDSDIPSHWLGYLNVDSTEKCKASIEQSDGTLIHESKNFIVFSNQNGAITKAVAASVESNNPQRPGSIIWNELLSTNPTAAAQFYKKICGWNDVSIDMWPSGAYHIFQRHGLNIAGMQAINPKWMHKDNWIPFFLSDSLSDSRRRITEAGGELITDILHLPQFGQYSVALDNMGAIFAIVQRK